MVTIKEYAAPFDLDEAYEMLLSKRNNVVLGGFGFLKMSSKNINTAIDLCNLGLDYIRKEGGNLLIGADTSLRSVEISEDVKSLCSGVLSNAVSNIVGVQFRNSARMGASVFARYGFSDILPALLVLDASVRLHKGGVMSLEKFLDKKHERDILLEIIMPVKEGTACYGCIRISSGDFAILNGAICKDYDGKFKVAIGARPQRARLAENAGEMLQQDSSKEGIAMAAKEAARELVFGSNSRGSAEYRSDMCKALIERMMEKAGEEYD